MNTDSTSDAKSLIINPFYAVVFAPHIFKKHTDGPKEDWVTANAHLINDMGAEAWLGELLDVLASSRAKYDGHDIINPTLTINISDRLQGEHPPLVTRKEWVKANVKLIDELEATAWLWLLLEVLETGGPET